MHTDERRPTLKQDAVDIARIVDALDNIGIYNRAVNPHDVPVETSCLHNTEIALLYTSKPKHIISSGPYQTKKMIQMAEIACGGKDEFRNNPPCANSSPVSPLHITANAAETAMLVAQAGLPNNIITMVQQGSTSPATFAGSVLVHNKEIAFHILENHKQGNALTDDKVKAIRQVIVDAEEELGVANFWKDKQTERFIDN